MNVPKPATLNRDPGLQPERTSLAWSRTLYVLILDSAGFIRLGWLKHLPIITGAGMALLGLAAAIIAIKYYRISTAPYNLYRPDLTPAQKYGLFRLTSFVVLVVAAMIGYSTLSAR